MSLHHLFSSQTLGTVIVSLFKSSFNPLMGSIHPLEKSSSHDHISHLFTKKPSSSHHHFLLAVATGWSPVFHSCLCANHCPYCGQMILSCCPLLQIFQGIPKTRAKPHYQPEEPGGLTISHWLSSLTFLCSWYSSNTDFLIISTHSFLQSHILFSLPCT
jgi:hypothetical protein